MFVLKDWNQFIKFRSLKPLKVNFNLILSKIWLSLKWLLRVLIISKEIPRIINHPSLRFHQQRLELVVLLSRFVIVCYQFFTQANQKIKFLFVKHLKFVASSIDLSQFDKFWWNYLHLHRKLVRDRRTELLVQTVGVQVKLAKGKKKCLALEAHYKVLTSNSNNFDCDRYD